MQMISSMSAADPLILYTSIINKTLEFNKAVSVPIQRNAHLFWLRHTDTPTCWTYELLWTIMKHFFHTGCSVVKVVTEEAGLHFCQYSWPYWLATLAEDEMGFSGLLGIQKFLKYSVPFVAFFPFSLRYLSACFLQTGILQEAEVDQL